MSRQRLRQSQRTQKGRSRIRRTPQRSRQSSRKNQTRLRRRILCIRGKVPRRTVRSDSHRRSSGQRNRQKHPPETPRRSRQILQRNLRNHRREQNRRRSTRSAQIINIFFFRGFRDPGNVCVLTQPRTTTQNKGSDAYTAHMSVL